ncbi:hypothetical protein ANCCAN_14069 [Ancylostoma caninum]|uniref:Uncharacterized protein n=1 Tax=Ancylostoma caninum TaxID=29170 RepID=A0A368G6D9_ANCCA|nr:hypothetical protein ANCCAN_14069 [Ancylostoma caninum]
MYLAVFSAVLCISSGASFIRHSHLSSALTGQQTLEDSNEYPTSEESSKRVVLEPPLIKRSVDPLAIPRLIREPPLKRIDPLSIPQLIREPPLKRGDKRDSYVYPSTSSQLRDRVPLREPPLKRRDYESEMEMDPSGTVYLFPSEEDTLWKDLFEVASDEDLNEGRADVFVRPSSKRMTTFPRRSFRERSTLRRPLLGPSLLLPLPQRQSTSSVHTRPLFLTRLWR